MVRSLPAILLILACSCRSDGSTRDGAKMSKKYIGGSSKFKTWEDLDRYDGQYVSIEGTFNHIGGRIGVIHTGNGLKVNIPHFDVFARGQSWFDYLGKLVQAEGILHTYTRPIEGYDTTTLEIREFAVIGDSEPSDGDTQN